MPDPPTTDPAAVPSAAPAFAAVGRAEYLAMVAEDTAVAGRATDADLESFTAETLAAAGCAEYLDALRLLSWRARGLSRALDFIDTGGPRGTDDAMMQPIVVTAAALADLVTASFVIRDSNSENSARDDAAESWRDAIRQLSRLTGNEPIELARAPKRPD